MYTALIWTFTLYFTFYGVSSLRSTNDENYWEPLIKEVVEAGGYIHPDVGLTYLNFGGLTVIAKEYLPKDTLIMSVPQNLTLKQEDILSEFPSWSNLPILCEETDGAGFSLYMAYYANSKDSSKIPLYLKYAPDSCTNGYYFEYDVVRMLDERGRSYFRSCQDSAVKEWDTIQEALKNGTIENDEILSSITFPQYKWATCLTYSRRYRRENSPGSLLIPLGDMFNHDSNYNTYWQFSPETSKWTWTSTGVAKGEPITISYGWTKENLELLFVYGFSVKENPNELGHFLRPVEGTVKNMIFDLYKDIDRNYMPYTVNGISNTELILSRIASLPEDQLTSYHISKLISGDIIYPLEITLWDSIYRNCFSHMKEIPGESIEEDQILLEEAERVMKTKKSEGDHKYWMTKVAVLQYRIERRTFLQRVCVWIYENFKKVGGDY